MREGIVELDQPLRLMSGEILDKPRISWRLLGDPHLPVVLVGGGISAGKQAWTDVCESAKGWWQAQIGPGQAVDTNCFRVLAFDYLGGNGETTGPTGWNGENGNDPALFPAIDTADQADLAACLLNALGIDRLASFIGASYGGMVAQQFAARHPQRLNKALVICAGHEATPLATGWRHVQRQVLGLGLDCGEVARAVSIARSLAMCTYRSDREFSKRFATGVNPASSATAYLDHCGAHFARRFNIYAYLCLSQSIDDHHVQPQEISVPVDLAGFNSDQIVPVRQLIALRQLLGSKCSLTLSDSIYGHDAFLKEENAVSGVIREHLESLQ